MRAALGLLACALSAGCGYIGDPLPPALNIAMPVTDLRALEYGDRILVDFTIPPRTAEGLVVRRLGTVDLRAGPGTAPFDTDRWAGSAHKLIVPAEKAGPVHTDLPVSEWAGKEIIIAVRVVNSKGRVSAWSNLAVLPVVAPVPAPSGLAASSAPQGVRLTWHTSGHSFRIFRQGPGDKQPVLAGTAEAPEYVDATAQFETAYQYLVQALRDRAESVVSQPVSITPKDTFPPASPSGLTGVAGIGAIELVWDRNTEADLRGYRVYRAVNDGQLERIAEFVDTPAYSDRQIEAGKKYRYAISAIDQTGNESPKSATILITAP